MYMAQTVWNVFKKHAHLIANGKWHNFHLIMTKNDSKMTVYDFTQFYLKKLI